MSALVDGAVSPTFPLTFAGLDAAFPSPTPSMTAASEGRDSDISVAWTPADSAVLYRVDGWGAPYFAVNSNGNVSVRSFGDETLPHQEIDLLKVVKKATDPTDSGGLGLPLPLIIRFPDVLKHRLESLNYSFSSAIESLGYESHYQGVYPVKCNQDKFVVEDIVRFGSDFCFGLEAGSKPELLLAMSCLCNENPGRPFLVCNGFKDAEYISLALLARKLHLNSVIVLEQEEELDTVIQVSNKLCIRPVVGLRAKLRTKHSGHFGSTSGEKGKFGLTTTQILRVVAKLRKCDMLDCLQLLHFHIGSQIPNTDLLADGVREAAQIYCELLRLGADMKVIDIGGGLGIDYDGSKSGNSDISVAYSLQEYASAVVKAVKFVCDGKGVAHPILCSESGRAIVSHHSILVFEAMSTTACDAPLNPSTDLKYFMEQVTDDALADYQTICAAAMCDDYNTSLNYAVKLKQKCVEKFKQGSLGMEHLAAVDALCEFVFKAIVASDPIHTYHINLSIFTSIPDFWGISQLFPIIPIHKLDEKPNARGILSDLTCDSDGKIDKFITGETSLPLHKLPNNGGGGYYLGMFLGGAYEEALGCVHNLFGGPSLVRVVQSNSPHGFSVTRAVPGVSCADVLRVMQFEPEVMYETLKERTEQVTEDSDEVMKGVGCCLDNMPYLSKARSCGNRGSELE